MWALGQARGPRRIITTPTWARLAKVTAVGVVRLAAHVDAGRKRSCHSERTAEAEARLDLVEHERYVVVAREQAQRPEEARGRVAVAALALHRLDDAHEVLAAREALVDCHERRDLGREQRIVVAVAEALEELVEGRRCRREA